MDSTTQTPSSLSIAPRSRCALIAAFLILATITAYLPALRSAYIWDDDKHITQNQSLRSAAGLHDIWLKTSATPQYYPLVHTTFWIEYHTWALRPFGYHAVNLLLHILNALLLWRIAARLKIPGAAWIALLFALHPVSVETVAWISERKNLLSTLFYFLALDAYLTYWPLDEDRPRNSAMYVAALFLFTLALLSKTVACTLPAAILLLTWWKTGRVTWRRILGTLPMFLLGAALGLLTATLERDQVGAHGPEWAISPLARLLIAGRASLFYAAKALWPIPVIFNYPRWTIDPHQIWQFTFPCVVIAILITFYLLRNRIGRGPLTLALLFLVTLFPALGFINVYPMRYSFVADHFQYVAQIAMIIAAVWCAMKLTQNRRLLASIGSIIAIAFALLTYQHAQAFANERTLWQDTLRQNDQSWIACYNLGADLQTAGDLDGAIELYQHAITLRPTDLNGYSKLALLYSANHDDPQAVNYFRLAMKIDANDYPTLINFATALGRAHDFEGSEAIARRAIRLRPDTPAGYSLLGQSLGSQGRFDEAESALRKSVELDERSPQARLTLAMLLANRGSITDAEQQCRDALKLDASFTPARTLLIRLLRDSGHDSQAREEEQKAFANSPPPPANGPTAAPPPR